MVDPISGLMMNAARLVFSVLGVIIFIGLLIFFWVRSGRFKGE